MADVEWNMICRVCLQEGVMTSIYEKDETNKTIQEKIGLCSPIKFVKGTNLPEQICSICLQDLTVAYRFYSNCESTEAVLKSITENLLYEVIVPDTYHNNLTLNINQYKLPADILIKKIPSSNIKVEPSSDADDVDPNIEFLDYIQNSNDSQDTTSQTLNESQIESENYTHELIQRYKDENSSNDISHMLEVNEDDQEEHDYEIQQNSDYEYGEEYSTTTVRPVKTNKHRQQRTNTFFDSINRAATIEDITTQIGPNGVETTLIRVKRQPKREHTLTKPLKVCDICGNTYKYQHALESHMRRHRGEKPFACTMCDKAFVIPFELKRHMRTHTGQKPYSCKYCDRRFSDFGSRIKHERSHTGERPYKCAQCPKTFAYSHVLASHMLTHTGEKKYGCEECGKRFTKSHHLKAHKNTHSRAQLKANGNKLLKTIINVNNSNIISNSNTNETIVKLENNNITTEEIVQTDQEMLEEFAKHNNVILEELDVITIITPNTKMEIKSENDEMVALDNDEDCNSEFVDDDDSHIQIMEDGNCIEHEIIQ